MLYKCNKNLKKTNLKVEKGAPCVFHSTNVLCTVFLYQNAVIIFLFLLNRHCPFRQKYIFIYYLLLCLDYQ